MQATILRETGWTVLQYRDQPAGDIFDLNAHLNEHPPAYRILDWVHLERKKAPLQSRAREPIASSDAEMQEMMQALGTGAQPMPEHIRAQMLWAREQADRLRAATDSRA